MAPFRKPSTLLWTLLPIPCLVLACGGTATTQQNAGAGGATATSSTTSAQGGSGGAGGQGGGSGCSDPVDPGAFEVGTGERCFERLSPGDTVSVISGPQGGYHVWASLLCPDCGPQPIVSYATRDVVSHTELSWENSAIGAPQGPAGRIAGLQAPLPGAPWDPANVLPKGTHVLLWVGERDAAGNLLREAEVEVVLGDEVAWSPCADDPNDCPDG